MNVLLIVNPVSGIGGAVGLKGSDSPERQREAIARGAVPRAFERTKAFLGTIAAQAPIKWLVPKELQVQVSGSEPYDLPDTPDRTQIIMRDLGQNADLVVFVGGDGTARDVLIGSESHASTALCLGIPAGVKMHSGVFAVSPQAAGKIVNQIVKGELVTAIERDVRDYDDNEASIIKYGQLRVPEAAGWLQQTKVGGKEDEGIAVEEIVADVSENLSAVRPLVLGPGSTMMRIKEAFGIAGTLRGFDILNDGENQIDVAEKELLAVAGDAHFVVSFARAQGFLLGRGNQQFSAKVIYQIDFDKQVTIVATRTKVLSLGGAPLLVDTGDAELDKKLMGVYEITSGYEDNLIYRIEPASG